MADHTILFTVTPRAVSVEPGTLPVSVLVSPRLTGGERLGELPDWVGWTAMLQRNGLALEVATDGRTVTVPIDTRVLRPDLWEELFDAETLVEPHTFDDYSGRPVISYSVLDCLTALKGVYQEAAVALALPDPPSEEEDPRDDVDEDRDHGDDGSGRRFRVPTNRDRLRSLVTGLDVHWNGDSAPRWRGVVRGQVANPPPRATRMLDAGGLPVLEVRPSASDLKGAALPFSAFHNMPSPPERDDLTIDPATLFDFHKALSALNSYPRILRALGLVFDVELPGDFVEVKPVPDVSRLWVDAVTTSAEWSSPPSVRSLPTAVVHSVIDGTRRWFFAAPKLLKEYPPGVPENERSHTLVLGLLGLQAPGFGLAQLDVDGGMHKAIMAAETVNPPPGHNLEPAARPHRAPNPEVFDPEATLPALRSGGLTLYADRAGRALLTAVKDSKAFDDAVTGAGPEDTLFADDLVRGYRLDVWDSITEAWHSLHLRRASYAVGEVDLDAEPVVEEGFVELAVTQPAPGAKPETDDLYVHEAVARWRGWSLSVPLPFRHLTRYPDAASALPDPQPGDPPGKFDENEPVTPFKVTSTYEVVGGSLPALRFGARYRMRARTVDLAGNSLLPDDPFAELASASLALPRDPEGIAYLRYEPVAAPLVVIRDPAAVTEPGSAVHRLVLRTFNASPDQDGAPADASIADRHIVPPRTSVEMAERLGMFDEPFGKLKGDAATWDLIATRDKGNLATESIAVAGGEPADYPVEAGPTVDDIPYLPEGLSVGAAIRDLPGAPAGVVGRADPGAGPAGPVDYRAVDDANPRPGSATIVGFGGPGWEQRQGFRLALADPAPGLAGQPPSWDPAARVLTVHLPKGATATVPLTSYVGPRDLNLLGVWQWLREYVERVVEVPDRQSLRPGADHVAHVLQRAVEGGHWMLTPPTLLTLVHAVQQPIGRPTFTAVNVDHPGGDAFGLQTAPARGSADPAELAPVTAWRELGSTQAYLLGALEVHGASTARVDLEAAWDDPVDVPPATPGDPPTVPGTEHHTGTADEIQLRALGNGYLYAPGHKKRKVGYYDPEHDQIAFVRTGDMSRPGLGHPTTFRLAAPRHELGDAKRHVVTYTPRATSRYQEYFVQGPGADFTRTGDAVVVDIPASARPLAPDVAYVVPTFGWQRQTDTSLKRSVRFGGGLRVYLRRPWYSSGTGELLGVALYDQSSVGPLTQETRSRYKPFVTQWGMDPIWQSAPLTGAPGIDDFADAAEHDSSVTLEEATARIPPNQPGRVDVVGFEPAFDDTRGLWFADLTIDVPSDTYMPFVRLALVRYQPHALADAMISRVVLADFAQLTPDRTATVTADPQHPRTVRVTVSGVAPQGPVAQVRGEQPGLLADKPTKVRVRVQRRDPAVASDLAWDDVDESVARITVTRDGTVQDRPFLELWSGTVTFADRPAAGELRLLVEERELVSARSMTIEGDVARQPSRLIYAETFLLDEVLTGS